MKTIFVFLIWFGLFRLCAIGGETNNIMLLFFAIGAAFGVIVLPDLIASQKRKG